ncbi:MAG TPA: response regulator [Acetobacteraceae bacterium]|nr:response regulator [Acetobacteraceae bacterium]
MKHPASVRAVFPRVVVLAALAIGAGLLLGGWVILVGADLTHTGQNAGQRASLSAQGVAASIDATLARFADQVQSVRPAEFAASDRLQMADRLLRLQALMPAATTFMLAADGHLLAASTPFAREDAQVGDQPWFRRAVTTPAGALEPQHLATPWLGVNDGIALTRAVADSDGTVVGVVGAVLPRKMVAALLAPHWLPSQVALALVGGPEGVLAVPAPGQPGGADSGSDRSQRLMLSMLAWFGQPTSWVGTAPLHTIAAAVTATLPTSIALPRHMLDAPIIASGGTLVAAWLVCLCGAAMGRRRTGGRGVFGVDWECRVDASGTVTARYGTLPPALSGAVGQKLVAVLALPNDSQQAAALGAALRDRQPLDDLEVAIDDRTWRLAIAPESDGGFICTARDVTGEAAAVSARLAAEAALAEARRSQDRLLTSLGHDIRTPMASIMGTCELLLDGELEQDQRAWLERVQGSCGALLGMLNGLLAVSEDQSGRGALLCEPVDVSALVQEVVDVLAPQAHDKGLELHTRCDDLLRGQWLVDPSRLRQVVFNLASNAVKYTTRGRVEIRASAVVVDGRQRLRFAVSDTGPGIDPSEREVIFERFRRGRAQDGATQGGLGLGLALCRDNARVMNGSITLESAIGVGSEFTFECPAERVPVQKRQLPFAGRTALVVADDGPVRRALSGQLAELGLLVETAPDGYLGLALAERLEAQRGAVDLVVLQSNLPGMPGEVFVIRLRRTAFGSRAALIWMGGGAENAEVDAIVPAPADPHQVAAVARQLLSQRPSLDMLTPNISAGSGGRVLLVEDDKANRTLLVAALTRRGFAVFTAGSGEEALRLAGRDSFDAILMDLQMPGLDGFETTRRIRALGGHVAQVPIIALTAWQAAKLGERCGEAGLSAVMEKPVNLERLTAALHHAIGTAIPTEAPTDKAAYADSAAYVADVSVAYMEEMVAVVGINRARAGVAEFLSDASARCCRLGELLPGWEVGAILRCCEEISGRSETCGALALGELLEEIADAASRDDHDAAANMVGRLDAVVARLPGAMHACLDDIERRWSRGSSRAA